MWKKIFRVLINKYFLTTIAFVIWLLFFDSNNIFVRVKLQNQLKKLQHEKAFFLDEIRQDSLLNQKLLTDTAELEKFAREKYLMKKEGEDVFLVIDTSVGYP